MNSTLNYDIQYLCHHNPLLNTNGGTMAPRVSRALKYIVKKVFVTFDNVFHTYLMIRLKKNAIFFFSRWPFFLNPIYPFLDAHGQAG